VNDAESALTIFYSSWHTKLPLNSFILMFLVGFVGC
jgi:hypothetical protein